MKRIIIVILMMLAAVASCFAQGTIPKTWVASETIKASDLNSNFDYLMGAVYNIGSDNFDPGYVLPASRIENGQWIASHALRHTQNQPDRFTASMTLTVNTIGTHTGAVIGSFTGDYVGTFTGRVLVPGNGVPATASDVVTLAYFQSSQRMSGGVVMNTGWYNTQIYGTLWTPNASWTAPFSGPIYVTVVGGGGGGGGVTGNNRGAGGGGSGGFCYREVYTVSSGTVYDLVVGAAGTGASVSSSYGGTGGTSYFGSGGSQIIYCTGGTGGGTASSANYGIGGDGGSAFYSGGKALANPPNYFQYGYLWLWNGSSLYSEAQSGEDGSDSSPNAGGAGGGNIFGRGGNFKFARTTATAGTGNHAHGFGGGGGGAATGAGGGTYSGASGTSGLVLIEW